LRIQPAQVATLPPLRTIVSAAGDRSGARTSRRR
jgi:hypothetical protein